MDRPICRVCSKNLACNKGRRKDGSIKYGTKCQTCKRHGSGKSQPRVLLSDAERAENKRRKNRRKSKRGEIRKRPWLLHRKDSCEQCGFVAEHPCQLDVDHIDGCRANNDPSNYMTLCANCHRLKTLRSGDHLTPATQTPGDRKQLFLFH